jgi:hypothetical protein
VCRVFEIPHDLHSVALFSLETFLIAIFLVEANLRTRLPVASTTEIQKSTFRAFGGTTFGTGNILPGFLAADFIEYDDGLTQRYVELNSELPGRNVGSLFVHHIFNVASVVLEHR